MSFSEQARNRLIKQGIDALERVSDPVQDPGQSEGLSLITDSQMAARYLQAVAYATADNPLPNGARRYYDEYRYMQKHDKCEIFDVYTANFLHDIQSWTAVGPAALIAFAHMAQLHMAHCKDFQRTHFLQAGFIETRAHDYAHRGIKRS